VPVVPHNHGGHLTFTGEQQGHLFFQVPGYVGKLAEKFVRDDLVGRYSSAVEVLEELQLAGLEAAYLPVDSIDGSGLVIPDDFAGSRYSSSWA
jgi:hypothetical protein